MLVWLSKMDLASGFCTLTLRMPIDVNGISYSRFNSCHLGISRHVLGMLQVLWADLMLGAFAQFVEAGTTKLNTSC